MACCTGRKRCSCAASLVRSMARAGTLLAPTATFPQRTYTEREGCMGEMHPAPKHVHKPSLHPYLPARDHLPARTAHTMGLGLLTGSSSPAQQPPWLSLLSPPSTSNCPFPHEDLHGGTRGLSPGSYPAPFLTSVRKVLSGSHGDGTFTV